jgi:hypothetical protein
VLAELDDLIGRHAGADAQRALLSEVSAGACEFAAFERGDIARAERVLERYADLALGLTDASIVVLPERLTLTTLLSLEQRHFRALQGHGSRPFRLLPFDR